MDSREQQEWANQRVPEISLEKCCRCIYRIPRCIRDAQKNEKTYEPQTMSIGPYHIDSREQDSDINVYKRFTLYQILQRTGQDLNLYLDVIRKVENQARACYQQDDKLEKLSSNEFVEMMVLDGCFILELFRCYPNNKSNNPVFDDKRIVENILLEMLMLENQIPLFVINMLLDLMDPANNRRYQALDLVLIFFNPEWLTGIQMQEKEFDEFKQSMKQHEEYLHVLDIFRRGLIHVKPQQNTAKDRISSHEQVLHSVTELRKGGVKFKKRKTNCFLDFKFSNGVLEIPPIWIHDNTMTILLNLAAFEHCHMKISDAVIASYVAFMECLIKTPEDAAHLHQHGIILGDDTQVVDMFKSVSKDMLINLREGYYAKLSREVNIYYSQGRNKLRASLYQNYFYNPWAIISLAAATILLLLTATQTFYAVFAYHMPNS